MTLAVLPVLLLLAPAARASDPRPPGDVPVVVVPPVIVVVVVPPVAGVPAVAPAVDGRRSVLRLRASSCTRGPEPRDPRQPAAAASRS
jgi:hypothetical protein